MAALMAGGAITQSAQFDRIADTGVYRLLYELWGTPALASYIEDALGPLRAGDKRGILRETSLAYLDRRRLANRDRRRAPASTATR